MAASAVPQRPNVTLSLFENAVDEPMSPVAVPGAAAEPRPDAVATNLQSPAPTLIASLARYFTARPNRWIDGRELADVGGAYAWRSRLSDLRRPPFGMHIENRQRREVDAAGRPFVISEYRYLPIVRSERS